MTTGHPRYRCTLLVALTILFSVSVVPLHAQSCFGGDGPVTLWLPWQPSEVDILLGVLAPVAEGCVEVVTFDPGNYGTQLQTAVAAGTPPDIALLQDTTLLGNLVFSGTLMPLGELGLNPDNYFSNNYLGGWSFDPESDSYALGVGITPVSSVVWYSPQEFEAWGIPVPTSYGEFLELLDNLPSERRPLSFSENGWSGFNLVQDLLTANAGLGYVYDILGRPEEIDSNPLTDAFNQFSNLYAEYSYIGADFSDAILAPFGSAPQAWMTISGGFAADIIQGNYPEYRYGRDYAAFPLYVPLQSMGQFVVAFDGRPGVQVILNYLSSDEGGAAWTDSGLGLSAVIPQSPWSYSNFSQADLGRYLQDLGLAYSLQGLINPEMSSMMQQMTMSVASGGATGEEASGQVVSGVAVGSCPGYWVCVSYSYYGCTRWVWKTRC